MQRLDVDYVSQLTRDDVLALDIAEHCGYHSAHSSGVEHFPSTDRAAKKFGSDYQQHLVFGKWLKEIVQKEGIKVIAAEDVNVGKSFLALRKLSEFRGVLLYVCAELNIPVVFFNVADIKRFATGNGNANKKMMIDYCVKRWHIQPKDDNEADAIHIFFHFVKRYKL